MPVSDLDTLCVNTIRTLSTDAVQQANSGHPGTPVAAVAYTLWQRARPNRLSGAFRLCIQSRMPSGRYPCRDHGFSAAATNHSGLAERLASLAGTPHR